MYTYKYNGQNRMTYSEVTNHAERTHGASAYAYDALGRRTLTQGAAGQALRTVYDGMSFEVIREGETFRDGSLTTQYAGSVQARGGSQLQGSALRSNEPTGERYRWIGEGGGTTTATEEGYAVQGGRYGARGVTLYGNGEAVAVSYSSSLGSRSSYLGKDVMGSVRSASGDLGSIEDRYEYDAFGKPYKGDLSGGMNLGYTGKPYDAATGLYNYGYRDYKPQVARFSTVDPIRDGNNWFAYVNNDPVNWRDLWGLCASDGKSKWKDNRDGTYTALPGATLWDLYGNNWLAMSGFTRDPTTLKEGETVGIPTTNPTPSLPSSQPSSTDTQIISDTSSNTSKNWFDKKEGEQLTNEETIKQISLGVVEITIGIVGGGVITFYTGSSSGIYLGAFLTLDGAVLIKYGLQNIKKNPLIFGIETLLLFPGIPSNALPWNKK